VTRALVEFHAIPDPSLPAAQASAKSVRRAASGSRLQIAYGRLHSCCGCLTFQQTPEGSLERAVGTLIFGLLGLAASVPVLLRLKRRFGAWWAPALGLAVFAAMFSVSAFVIGPAISGTIKLSSRSCQPQLPC
jgi:hypothetical protein